MALSITSLNSGSNGNCYYIGNEDAAVLVDAGISCRETVRRMARLGLPIERVKGIFVSHEHSDHINGLEQLSKKYQLPVYITGNTLKNTCLKIQPHLTIPFRAFEPVSVHGISVTAFPKFHHANDPHSFIVSCKDIHVGILTDIGRACEQVIHHFKQCHAAFLEANYDEEMLRNGSYPYHLKQRISAGSGHLSNTQALQIFLEHRPAFMSHLILSHLSKNNNNPEIVLDLFGKHARNTEIIIASRFEETPVYHISDTTVRTAAPLPYKLKGKRQQLTLFGD